MPEVHVINDEGALNEVGEFRTMRADVLWVYKNFRNCVRNTENRIQIDLSKATSPPPSEGAILLLEWAAANKNEFMGSTLHKYLSKDELAEESEGEKQERKSLVELRRLAEDTRREFERSQKEKGR
jgi:hypothetical protein